MKEEIDEIPNREMRAMAVAMAKSLDLRAGGDLVLRSLGAGAKGLYPATHWR